MVVQYTTTASTTAAKDVTSNQVTDLLRPLVEIEIGRTAGRVRSLMHAAYALALEAPTDPAASSSMLKFGITDNPVSRVASLSQFNRTRDRSLSKRELGVVWRELNNPTIRDRVQLARAVRLDLLLGGQRCEQLLRAKTSDVNLDDNMIVLYDPKGNRPTPRTHELPLTARAKEEVLWLLRRAESAKSPYLFFGLKPDVKLRADTVSKFVTRLSKRLNVDANMKRFRYQDFRRTTESLMTSIGVLKETRGQVLSHGLSGVQDRNYQRHEFLVEKLDALTRWEAFLLSLDTQEGAA